MTAGYFLWPKSNRLRAVFNAPRCVSNTVVEQKMQSMFVGGFPVLFSSGRSALFHALLISGVSRGSDVGVFPYASHCVFDAVTRVATPRALASTNQLNVVFQQWGFKQHCQLSQTDIEDCADTLLMPGGKLFQGGGRFEIWSLPKILGTLGGGVLWCSSDKDARAIREIRDANNYSGGLWALRLFAENSSVVYGLWQGADASRGKPSCLQNGEVMLQLNLWDKIVEDRERKFNQIRALAPDWLECATDRLPCVLPVEIPKSLNCDKLLEQFGIITGERMIEATDSYQVRSLRKVLPIPIHQDVPYSMIVDLLDVISMQIKEKN
tara:strand:+ start:1832 stop:2800 length:969 start_codon:yes stop_codon:yes gene_type:complete